MSSYAYAEVAHLGFSATPPADPADPTIAEANASIDLRGFMIEGDFPLAGETIEDGVVLSRYKGQIAGNYGGDPIEIEFKLDNAGSPPDGGLAWLTLPAGTTGGFYVSRFGLATPGTFAATDIIEYWPIEVTSRNPSPIGFDTGRARFTSVCAVPSPGPLIDFPLATP